jgi:hypothetical protein
MGARWVRQTFWGGVKPSPKTPAKKNWRVRDGSANFFGRVRDGSANFFGRVRDGSANFFGRVRDGSAKKFLMGVCVWSNGYGGKVVGKKKCFLSTIHNYTLHTNYTPLKI